MLQHSHNVQHDDREGVTIFQRRFGHLDCNQHGLAWRELDLGLTLSALFRITFRNVFGFVQVRTSG